MPYRLDYTLITQTLLGFEQSTDLIDLNFRGSSQQNTNYIGRIAAVLANTLQLNRDQLRLDYLAAIGDSMTRDRNSYRVGDRQPNGIVWEHSSLMSALAQQGIVIERYPVAYTREMSILCYSGSNAERRRSGFIFAVALILLQGSSR